MSKREVERRHREAAALALSAGTKLEDNVLRWIAGEDTVHRVWNSVAQALADAESARDGELAAALARAEAAETRCRLLGKCVECADDLVEQIDTACPYGESPVKSMNALIRHAGWYRDARGEIAWLEKQ